MSVFDSWRDEAWKFRFAGQLCVGHLVGGTPSDPKVAEGWIRTKLGEKPEAEIERLVQAAIKERGVTPEEAVKIANEMKNLNGFKRDDNGLYIEGRQLKAAIKEAVSVAAAADKLNARGWGKTNKGILSFAAEHIFVQEERLYLGRTEADEIQQRFVSTWRGTGIQYEEVCHGVVLDFTILSDWEFAERDWAMIWLTGGRQGLGASRSQGYGTYEMTSWKPLS